MKTILFIAALALGTIGCAVPGGNEGPGGKPLLAPGGSEGPGGKGLLAPGGNEGGGGKPVALVFGGNEEGGGNLRVSWAGR